MINKDKVPFSELLLWNNKIVLEVSILCGKSEQTIKQYIKENKPCKVCQTLLIWLFYGIPKLITGMVGNIVKDLWLALMMKYSRSKT